MYKYLLSSAASGVAIIICLAMPLKQALALAPDQIALVVNRNEPQGVDLAQFYAKARGIPDDRIIALDVPFAEEIPFERFEQQVRPVIRKFLRDHSLQDKVKCLVTFYGVPLRIADRRYTPQDNFERERLTATLKLVQARLTALVADAEKRASEFDPTFKPVTAAITIDDLAHRTALVGQSISQSILRATDPARRQEIVEAASEIKIRFTAAVELDDAATPTTRPATQATPTDQLLDKPFDRAAREELRESVRRSGGIVPYARLLQGQIDYFATADTASALDSELSLVWWPAYSRTRFQPNLLNVKYRGTPGPPVMMVMRLDAPAPQTVRNIIANSVVVERNGLQGKVVIDSRGLPAKDSAGKEDAYGVFDEELRRLAAFIRTKTKLELVFDDKPQVLSPGAVNNVALYCGWYSVRQYVPGMKFSSGALGYHVASFEMVILHSETERGWVHGLLNDGIAGTVGPVAEPYLSSFPPPEEFFPLLLTGKLTLAEVYWATTPLTSWMQSCIGDPLYNPYQKNPAVLSKDLPSALQAAFP